MVGDMVRRAIRQVTVLAVLCLLCVALGPIRPAGAQSAAVLYVGAAPSGSDANPCTQPAPCATITRALSQVADGDRIEVGPGTFVEHLVVPDGLTVTIDGAGRTSTVLDGQWAARVVNVGWKATVTLSDLTVAKGTGDIGGGIYNRGTLRLEKAAVAYSSAQLGAGIYNERSLTVVDSEIASNQARVHGGGVENNGTVTFERSLVRNNIASDAGAGVYTSYSMYLYDTTISGNLATGANAFGGGIATPWDISIYGEHLTVTRNVAKFGGGIAFFPEKAGAKISASIFAGNSGGNCNHALTGSYNLDDDPAGICATPGNSSITGRDPQLSTEWDSGALTSVEVVPATSPAYGAVPASSPLCDGSDQRSVVRRYPLAAGCNIGSYESPLPETTIKGTSVDFGNQPTGTDVAATITVDNTGGRPLYITGVKDSSADFATGAGTCQSDSVPVPVPAGGSCQASVVFAVGKTGDYAGKVVLTDSVGGSYAVKLTGTGVLMSPKGLTPPTISGFPVVGGTLTAAPGTWTGSAPMTYTYQWYCLGSAKTPIPGAKTSTYTLTGAEVGCAVYVQVVARNAVGKSAPVESERTPAVAS